MNYRISLSYTLGGNFYSRITDANYNDKLSLDVGHDTSEEYYRKRLSGELTFANDDYTFIMGTALDTEITADIEYYDDLQMDWYPLLSCNFYRTDCKINVDDKIITVTPHPKDEYDEFLGGIDKEFDLVKIAPKITPILLDKRPCLQIYALGDTKITCILSNMWWEQDCKEERDIDTLTDTYKFAQWDDQISAVISGTHTPSVPTLFNGSTVAQTGAVQEWTLTSNGYKLRIRYDSNNQRLAVGILNSSDTLLFINEELNVEVLAFPRTMELQAVAASGATGTCMVNIDLVQFFARFISDAESINGTDTSELPLDDIVENNRNYGRVSPVPQQTNIGVGANSALSNNPTEWGIYQPNQYYTKPLFIGGEALPVCIHRWSRVSYWISESQELQAYESKGRKQVLLKDAYRMSDVISALLIAMGSSLYLVSEFLDNTAILDEEDTGLLFITPKSNLLNINYTEPAQKAPITLRQILDMLRSVYRCYWMIENGQLIVEHIEWFRNGGNYGISPSVGCDLTAYKTVRNGKYWDYLTNKYQYDKPDMPCRYEFGWDTPCTEPFEGRPLVMVSNYVNLSSVEKISMMGFDADIDYLLLNPSNASKDGFAIMRAEEYNAIDSPITYTSRLLVKSYVILYYETLKRESITMGFSVSGSGALYALDAQGERIGEPIYQWNNASSSYSMQFILPAGTASIQVYMPNVGDTFTLTSLIFDTLKVSYWDWHSDPNNNQKKTVLQNGYMSCAFTQRYYAYDMPCKQYTVGEGSVAVSKTAIGTSKKKTQSVTVPQAVFFDPMQTIKTGLGYGKIRKMNINLSSEAAETTLEYDTE